MEKRKFCEEQLIQLAKESQVRGYQYKRGIYLAVDKGFDTALNVKSFDYPEASLEVYVETCERGLINAFGGIKLKGILLKFVQLGILGSDWDARMQVNRDLIAGPFETENQAMEIAPYILQERYGWDPKSIERITFF